MDLSDIESFHCLFRSLWKPVCNAKRHHLNIMDTIIFQHGHPFRWIFTSEKTGEVLKKKECQLTAGEIVSALKKRAGKLRGKKIVHNERSKFASVWYRTETGLMAFRLLDEAELYFIIGDRTYTQFITAIQVYFSGYSHKGCGVFEHHCVAPGGSMPIHRTFEFVHMPQSIDIFDLNHQVGEIGVSTQLKDIMSDFRPSQTLSDEPPAKQERLNISEGQHEILKVQSVKLMKLVEKTVQCRVTKATFLYYFNTSWTPFVVACTKMQLESKGATIPGMLGKAGSAPARLTGSESDTVDRTTSNIKVDIERTDIHVVKAQQKKLQPQKPVRTSTTKDWEARDGITEKIAKDEETYASPGLAPPPVATRGGPFIPTPNSSMPKSGVNFDDERGGPSRAADKRQQVLKSKFGGKRHSVLENFIQVVPGKPSQEASVGDKRGGASSLERTLSLGRQGIRNDLSDKRVTAPTDNNFVRVRIDADNVRRSNNERWTFARDGNSRRPISAPHNSQARIRQLDATKNSLFPMSAGMQSYNLPKGRHGIAEGSTRASGMQKKLPLAGQVCFGDYCNLLTPRAITMDDTDEYLQSMNMMKSPGADGVVRLKCTKAEYQISCKTVLLGRAENKYLGSEVSVGDTMESSVDEDIINTCAQQHIVRVAEKCRKEAFSSLIRGGLEGVPSMSNLQATAFTYRNLIYDDALSQMHPSRFYYTVPACKVCSLLYSALDKARDSVIHRPTSSQFPIRQLGVQDGGDHGADIVKKSRETLRERADNYRSHLDAEKRTQKGECRRKVGEYLPDDFADEGIYEDFGPDDVRGTGTGYLAEDDVVNKLETCVGRDEISTIVSPGVSGPDNVDMARVCRHVDDDIWEHDAADSRPRSTKNKEMSPYDGLARGRDTSHPSYLLQDRDVATRVRDRAMSRSAQRATMTSPEALLRRQNVMDIRKADRTQWHDSLRDERLSPTPAARRKRSSSAAPTASGVKVVDGVVKCDGKRPPFAVRSGEDLKTITGTFITVGPAKVRPKSAEATAYRKLKPPRVSTQLADENSIYASRSATYSVSEEGHEGGVNSSGLYLSDSERERLCKLREMILLERYGCGLDRLAASRGCLAASSSRRVMEVAQTLSKGDYSYGHVPFTDAQCLPYKGRGRTNSSGWDISAHIERGESSEELALLVSGTYSGVSPRDVPKMLPVSKYMKKTQKNKGSQQ